MAERIPNHDHKEGCVFCGMPQEQRFDVGVPSFYGYLDTESVPPKISIVPIKHHANPLEFDNREFKDLGKTIDEVTSSVRDPESDIFWGKGLEQGFSDWWRNPGANDHVVWRISPRDEGLGKGFDEVGFGGVADGGYEVESLG